MFGWFSKKDKKPVRRSSNLVWVISNAKWNALPNLLNEKQPVFIYGWFSSAIEHAMINSSILRAQQKIYEMVQSDFSAKTPEEWFSYSGLQRQD